MRNGGVLPSERLRQIISGVGVAAHGDREMPLWGRLFTPDDNRALGAKETGGRTALPIFREIMLRVYERQLVGPVPQFPHEIEDGIDQYLVRQAALEAERVTLADPPRRDTGIQFDRDRSQSP